MITGEKTPGPDIGKFSRGVKRRKRCVEMVFRIAKILVIRIIGAKCRAKRPDEVGLALDAQRGRALIEVLFWYLHDTLFLILKLTRLLLKFRYLILI